jgi:hypothetical protein
MKPLNKREPRNAVAHDSVIGERYMERIRLYFGNLIYTIIVIPSFVYFIINDSNDQFAALFIAALTFPWSFFLALILGVLGLEIPSLGMRSIILLLFVILNQLLIGVFFIKKKVFSSA